MMQYYLILCIRITFTFKSSRKSNNGTDINAGQIPEILYRTLIPDSLSISTIHTSNNDIHILSDNFSHTVNKVFILNNKCLNFRFLFVYEYDLLLFYIDTHYSNVKINFCIKNNIICIPLYL